MKETYHDTTNLLRRFCLWSSPLVMAVFLLATTFAALIVWQLEQDRLNMARMHASEVLFKHEEGKPHFWGGMVVVLRFPEFLQSAGLSQLEKQGFAYELWRIHPDTGKKEIIATSIAALMGEPVERTLKVFNIIWTLSITPIKGWSDPYGLSIKITLGLIFSALLTWLTKLIVDLRKNKAELEQLAFFDMLTGLPNRRLLRDRLYQAIARSKRSQKVVAVCFLDLDNFKSINDTLGHERGDHLLIEITKGFRSCLREQDTLARVGGDEFVILLQDLEETNEYNVVLERILKAAAIPIVLGDKSVVVSLSMGVTLYPQDDSDPETLLHHADKAMYQAKQNGKGQCCFFIKGSYTGTDG